MVTNLLHVIDQDLVDRNPLDQCAAFRAFDQMLHTLPHRLRNRDISLVPHGRK